MHHEAPDLATTDWSQVVALYDVLLRLTPSPVVELNRAVAVVTRDGPAVGLDLIDRAALELVGNEPERTYLTRRLAALRT